MKPQQPYDYRLRPYHNPQNADESLVPPGWRMLYADEFPLPHKHKIKCRLFIKPLGFTNSDPCCFGDRENCTGSLSYITYIVPVAS